MLKINARTGLPFVDSRKFGLNGRHTPPFVKAFSPEGIRRDGRSVVRGVASHIEQSV
jgi:hypothetical protein